MMGMLHDNDNFPEDDGDYVDKIYEIRSRALTSMLACTPSSPRRGFKVKWTRKPYLGSLKWTSEPELGSLKWTWQPDQARLNWTWKPDLASLNWMPENSLGNGSARVTLTSSPPVGL